MEVYNIYTLAKECGNLNLTIKAGELVEAIEYCINKTLEYRAVDANAETYLKIAETAEKLDVDKSTLHRWKKQGYLMPVSVGGGRRYRKSDVERILEGGKVA